MKKLLVNSLIILFCIVQQSYNQVGWNLISTLPERHLYSVFFTEINTGYIAGGFGTGKILKTTDGGITWSETTFPVHSLHSVCFINANIGWTVGAGGSIYKTTNGGTTWLSLSSGTTLNLNSVYFINENFGWVVGQTATILRTTDGGVSWSPRTFGASAGDHLYCVRFVDENVGHAGGNGFAIRTANGGLEWRHVTKFTPAPVTSIYFTDYEKGFVVSERYIFKTVDGGINWTFIEYSESLFSIYFIDSNRGWICGNLGTILKTTNGGDSWITQRSGTEYFISIFFKDLLHGWVVGEGADGGKIFKTTTGGTLDVEEDISIPNDYILLQNYPNPFNPKTTIRFGIPEYSHVNVTIYNVLGEKVAILNSTDLPPGYYEKTWDAKNVSSGIYICSMETRSVLKGNVLRNIKKIVLLK
ncbi:MAG: T9SS type A sorting domain-containing protein [Actinobacteria bacterium]|nr:T9SS type A sorting domain-containing protein [Actinomycetota bacterium]